MKKVNHETLIQILEKSGGITLEYDMNECKSSAWCVGMHQTFEKHMNFNEFKKDKKAAAAMLIQAIRYCKYLTAEFADRLFEFKVGMWIDSGVVVCEPVQITEDTQKALEFAIYRNQKSIYHLGMKQYVDILRLKGLFDGDSL